MAKNEGSNNTLKSSEDHDSERRNAKARQKAAKTAHPTGAGEANALAGTGLSTAHARVVELETREATAKAVNVKRLADQAVRGFTLWVANDEYARGLFQDTETATATELINTGIEAIRAAYANDEGYFEELLQRLPERNATAVRRAVVRAVSLNSKILTANDFEFFGTEKEWYQGLLARMTNRNTGSPTRTFTPRITADTPEGVVTELTNTNVTRFQKWATQDDRGTAIFVDTDTTTAAALIEAGVQAIRAAYVNDLEEVNLAVSRLSPEQVTAVQRALVMGMKKYPKLLTKHGIRFDVMDADWFTELELQLSGRAVTPLSQVKTAPSQRELERQHA